MKKILQFAVIAIFFLSINGCLKSTIDYTGLLTLIANRSGTPYVRGTVNNTFMKNILTVYSIPDQLIVAATQTDSYGQWALYVPPGEYNLQLYSANPMIVLDAGSPRELYQISQYELSVGSDGKSMVKGINLGQSDIFLTSVNAGRAMTVSTDNPQYLLYSRLMHGTYVVAKYGAGNTDVYALFSYGANNRVSNMREYLGTDASGTLYSDTRLYYNMAGSIESMAVENYVTANDTNTVFNYAADGKRILNIITRYGHSIGTGTNKSRSTYTYDTLNRPTEIKLEDWVDPVWNTVQSLIYTWNTDNTIYKLTITSGTSDYDFYFTYFGNNVTQLDVDDKIIPPDVRATYTLDTGTNLPSGSEFYTGNYVAGTWALAGNGTYTHEPTFGLLDHYTFGTESYYMTYDPRGKQLSVSQDRSDPLKDFYTVAIYDSNGNISTAEYYGEIPIVPPAYLTVTFTWQAL
jgi:hypothetical protein